jgi:hypothetical protein
MALQLPATTVARLLAQIFGPSVYDALIPRFDPSVLASGPVPDPWRGLGLLVRGPSPQPWQTVLLNPQPLPPREAFALSLADAHIHDILSLDRVATLFGGEVMERAQERALRQVSELEELCPRWPRWPKGWPPPPPPPWDDDEMTASALFVFGTRVLAAAEVAEQAPFQEGLTRLGERALELGMHG